MLHHNIPEFTVSDLSQQLKRTVESTFSRVRVKGEISGLMRHGSGHVYFALKDDQAVLDSVCWKGVAAGLSIQPEEGMEVIATGKLTTYPGRSKYQIMIESIEIAGEGALLKLLEERKKRLQAEGLFDESRKKPLPKLSKIIGVITSPTGAVIRDILHRIEDRMPTHVMVWPVAVQGEGAKDQITRAIDGFNAFQDNKPDLLIIARGGGSIEDLWCFNEEEICRAIAQSHIPIISAVGHETDFTLCDFAADKRAPTPTAAAEFAIPVRRDLMVHLQHLTSRIQGKLDILLDVFDKHLSYLKKSLPDLDQILAQGMLRADEWGTRLAFALKGFVGHKEGLKNTLAARLLHPHQLIQHKALELKGFEDRIKPVMTRIISQREEALMRTSQLLESYSYHRTLDRGFALVKDESGQIISSKASITPHQHMTLTLKDGDIRIQSL